MGKEKGKKIMGKNTDFIEEKRYISSVLFLKLKEFGAALGVHCITSTFWQARNFSK